MSDEAVDKVSMVRRLAWNSADDHCSAVTLRAIVGRTSVRAELWRKEPGGLSKVVWQYTSPTATPAAEQMELTGLTLLRTAAWLDRNGILVPR